MNKTVNMRWAALLLLLSVSCSVKEDRSPCPCWLSVVSSDAFRVAGRPQLIVRSVEDGTEILRDTLERSAEALIEYTVPKGRLTVIVRSELSRGREENGQVLFSEGESADTLWAHASEVDCGGEFTLDTVRMRRQFARVTVRPECGSWRKAGVTGLEVRTSCGGLDLRTLTPVEGSWHTHQQTDEDSGTEFLVPRLSPEGAFSLVIDLAGETEERDLQAALRASGYDWSRKDLDDIVVTFDVNLSVIAVSVEPWHAGEKYEENI